MGISSGQQIRAQVTEIQNNLGRHEIERLSEAVSHRFTSLFNSPSQWSGIRVGMYRPLPNEFDLKWIETFLRKTDVQIHYPRIYDRNLGLLEFVKVPLGSEIKYKKGPFGIDEPAPEYPSVDPNTLDVVFVPGQAFGPAGERMGKGAGFYDRILPKTGAALRIALAFDFQIFSQVEQQPWDQTMDWWLTETREFRSAKTESFLSRFKGAVNKGGAEKP